MTANHHAARNSTHTEITRIHSSTQTSDPSEESEWIYQTFPHRQITAALNHKYSAPATHSIQIHSNRADLWPSSSVWVMCHRTPDSVNSSDLHSLSVPHKCLFVWCGYSRWDNHDYNKTSFCSPLVLLTVTDCIQCLVMWSLRPELLNFMRNTDGDISGRGC